MIKCHGNVSSDIFVPDMEINMWDYSIVFLNRDQVMEINGNERAKNVIIFPQE